MRLPLSFSPSVQTLALFLAQLCMISATPAPANSTLQIPADKVPAGGEQLPLPQPVQVAHLQVFEQPKACDPFVESTANEFVTPNYPSEYPSSIDCIKIISAEPGQVIRLRFVEHFHLEPDGDHCRYDFLEVRDGQFGYSTLIGKLCGTTPPTVLESSGRHLWLRFHSDEDLNYIGFRAFVEFVPSSLARPDLDDCSFHLTGLEAFIDSADLGEEILTNRKDLSIQSLDCTWVIEAPKNQRIYLQFKDFKLEKANDCSFNFVEVYGSKTELYSTEGRLHQFCGSDTKPIFSKSNVLHLRFFTALSMDMTELGIGFKTKLSVYYNLYRDLATGIVDAAEPDRCKEPEEFDCTDNTCVAQTLVCNQIANCKQGNDEDKSKCKSNKAAFQMTMDLIVIAFIGCFLAAGMCSGLILNICRKLRQDKIELEEIRANLHKSRDSVGNTSAKSNKSKEQPSKSTSNSEHDLKSISIQDLKPTPVVSVQPEEPKPGPAPAAVNRNVSENSSSAESKDTVIYRPYYKDTAPPPPQPKEEPPPVKSSPFGFTFRPMRPAPTPSAPQQSTSSSIPYSPPPPYNPAAALLNKFTQPKISKKHVQVYDEPPSEPEEVHVIEVRDCACQTRESFTEKYLANVHFGQQRYYKPSSARSSPSILSPQQPPLPSSSVSKRAPLARGEAVEMLDVPRKHVRKIPKGPADVLMYPKSPSSIASVDASTGSLELLSEVDEDADEEKKPIPTQEESDDDEEDDDIMPESKPTKHRNSVSGYSELD